ncbi:RNA polymerase sigma factor [Streptosporangium sp. OZ121]|uniref:RNA polymerase sigma factor n=1 Tax=Streptosporangium sp. OZ121 TaxID=3444183 RepID=UPI003F7AFF81
MSVEPDDARDPAAPQHREPSSDDEIEKAYRRFRQPLVNFAYLVAEKHGVHKWQLDAESVVQEAFEAAINHGWANITSPRTWLFVVTRRLASRACDKTRRLRPTDMTDFDSAMPYQPMFVAQPATVEDLVIVRELVRDIGRLPNERERVSTLLSLHGWSGEEIAKYLNITTANVYVHAHHGRRKIIDRWSAFIPASDGDLRRSDVLAVTALAALGWALTMALLIWTGAPIILAVAGPPIAVAIIAITYWIVRTNRLER